MSFIEGHSRIFDDIMMERYHQIDKFGNDQSYLSNGTGYDRVNLSHTYRQLLEDARNQNDVEPNEATWESILREEFCEAMLESDPVALRNELIQTAAVCVKWIYQMDQEESA